MTLFERQRPAGPSAEPLQDVFDEPEAVEEPLDPADPSTPYVLAARGEQVVFGTPEDVEAATT